MRYATDRVQVFLKFLDVGERSLSIQLLKTTSTKTLEITTDKRFSKVHQWCNTSSRILMRKLVFFLGNFLIDCVGYITPSYDPINKNEHVST